MALKEALLALLLALCVEPVPVEFLQNMAIVPRQPGCTQVCQPDLCPVAHLLQRCPAGRVRDACGCCWECGNAEGQFCDADPAAGFYGRCAEGLRCRVPPRERARFLTSAAEEEETPKAVCVCAKHEVLCATDGKTYENKCQLRSAQRGLAQGESRPTVAHYGPCRSKPVITIGPQTSHMLEGSDAVFVCEVSSYPLATVHWRKDGKNIFRPSDDSNIATQARRGPQRFELTGWLQIQSVRPDDEGVYTCAARNAFGEASASARLQVLWKESQTASDEMKTKPYSIIDDEEDGEDEDYEGHSSGHMYV
ncbi:kazal-type serine peptidase inhibitor domain 2 [Alosa sapidissima]|uniref:kazal-type serine peptidase inhibitor domain 2 n=1 Tax=Alosa sapidissima TaxID=34773 RepID=UPI001C08F4DC|nr:kazal-type serine peptidase inhibitor domain 2 [Alosa sapidissima]